MTLRHFLVGLTVLATAVAVACDGDSDGPSATPAGEATPASEASPTGAASPAATAPPAPTATATPVPRSAEPAKLPQALMPADGVAQLLGAGYRTVQDKATDPNQPFSSVPTMGATLTAQNVSLVYNSFQVGAAPAAGRPFSAQNTVQGYPSAANAGIAFTALRTTWQGTLFQNIQAQTAPPGWDESFCQLGDYATAGGQQQQWLVCMARSGAYIVTVSSGGFPGLDAASVGNSVRAYFAVARSTLN